MNKKGKRQITSKGDSNFLKPKTAQVQSKGKNERYNSFRFLKGQSSAPSLYLKKRKEANIMTPKQRFGIKKNNLFHETGQLPIQSNSLNLLHPIISSNSIDSYHSPEHSRCTSKGSEKSSQSKIQKEDHNALRKRAMTSRISRNEMPSSGCFRPDVNSVTTLDKKKDVDRQLARASLIQQFKNIKQISFQAKEGSNPLSLQFKFYSPQGKSHKSKNEKTIKKLKKSIKTLKVEENKKRKMMEDLSIKNKIAKISTRFIKLKVLEKTLFSGFMEAKEANNKTKQRSTFHK